MRITSALTTAASTLAIGAAALSAPAFAQSAGSVDFEKEIVVTGASNRTQQVGGVSAPDTAKAKAVLTGENIMRGNSGQSVLNAINQVPGVSFQNNDAYGSSGGTLTIRGFDQTRISLTVDGIPLNDSGNYAIFSNQQIDPEVIDEVNVNLGTTDVDSPTASAVGGTVNIRSKTPDHDFGVMLSGSAGQFDLMRIAAKIETGDLSSSGTRAWFEASRATNRLPYNQYGRVNKQQYNAKIYQPLGGGGDFLALRLHYNQNRNNFFGSLPMRNDLTQSISNLAVRPVGPNASNRFPTNADERYYLINFPCQMRQGVFETLAQVSTPGYVDPDGPAPAPTNGASCGTEFDRRYNPSNTGNIGLQLKLHLKDDLVWTFEPSYQYVKANGGGTVTGNEGRRDIDPRGVNPLLPVSATNPALTNCAGLSPTASVAAGTYCTVGYIGGTPFFGRDVNGDGDALDTVTVLAPSQTQTHRVALTTSLRWEINDANTFRLGYTYDRAKHRQTGEVGLLQMNGEPFDVFPVNQGQLDAGGSLLEKRDRLSYAILHQFFGEYRGEFLDNKLVVTAGLTAKFFRRNLTQNCFTTSAGGFLDCFSASSPTNAVYNTLNPTVAPPQQRIFNYRKVTPNLGFVYHATDLISLFANYSQGISVPGTDNLYNSFFFAANTAGIKPKAETTDNFDAGVRFRSGQIQGAVSGFYNQFHNRTASAYDPVLDQNVYRNLGSVKKYGIDGYLYYQPNDMFTFGLNGSWLKSKIRDNIVIGENLDGTPIYALTAGKREAGMPKWTWGFLARANLGPVELGITGKRTGPRYLFDTNEGTFQGSFIPSGAKACPTATTCTSPGLSAPQLAATGPIFGATAHSYWQVDLDARLKLGFIKLADSYLQLNVYNLTNAFYIGGLGTSGTGLIQANTFNKTTGVSAYGSPNFAQIGAPRTISGSVVFKF